MDATYHADRFLECVVSSFLCAGEARECNKLGYTMTTDLCWDHAWRELEWAREWLGRLASTLP